MEKVLLTKEEIQAITNIQTQESDLIHQFGQVEYQIQSLKLQKQELNNQIVQLQTNSNKFGEDLQQKYGEGNINVETGEFTKTS
jgi:uncharacterized coiled-coil DUF342 family protein